MANNCKKGTGTFRSTMIPYSFMASCIIAYLLIFNLDAFAVDAFTPPKLHSTRYARSEIDNPSNYKRIYLVERYKRFSATTDKASLSTEVDPSSKSSPSPERMKKRRIPKIIMNVYINYITKLWRQTEPKEREKIAAQQALSAIKRVKHIMEGEEYVDMSDVNEGETLDEIDERIEARDELLLACNHMLHCLEKVDIPAPAMEIDAEKVKMAMEAVNSSNQKSVEPKKKKSRSVLFGAAMGAMVACWVFSGNVLFASFFTLMTALGQLEYYRMIMKTGIYPARRISVLGACSMFMTALFAPNLHQICLPVFATYAMIWFLTMRRKVSTISEIATTFTGMFYLGYIPSFWVRIRLIGSGMEPTRLAPILGPILEALGQKATSLPTFLPKCIKLPITTGAIFIFWTWISIAFSDVGAYFAGRKFGKTKLGQIFPAAGAASPNKTVEGYLGGTIFSACFATAGAWVMRWPYWFVTGPTHGILLAFLGLVGDLTASMLKRDSGMKDFGDLLPEHGGIMDRVDSYIFTAPYSWLVLQFLIPALKAKQRLAIP